jgi:hypothetical protein
MWLKYLAESNSVNRVSLIVTIGKPHGHLSDMDVDVGFVKEVAFTEIIYVF